MNNLFGQFKIYPRGFLGAKLPPTLIQRKSENWTRLQYDVKVFDANEPELVTANQEIAQAYATFIRRDIMAGDFAFREDTLRKILRAFGTMDFEAWYMAQYQSPSFGERQQEFLEDCFLFMWKGVRNLPLTTWDALLESSTNHITGHELPEHAASKFNKKYIRELQPSGRYRLTEVVQDWISKPNGFSDLLISANILFGFKQ